MSISAPSPVSPSTTPPRPRRWLRRVALLIALVVITLAAVWAYTKVAFEIALANAIAETDRLDPGWRLADLLATRTAIPDEENSAVHVLAVAKKGNHVSLFPGPVSKYNAVFGDLEKHAPTVRMNAEQVAMCRAELARIGAALAEARKLKDLARGRFPLVYRDDFFGTLRDDENLWPLRIVMSWLQADATLLAHEGEGDSDQAAESCLAILMAARSMDGELFLGTHRLRTAVHAIALPTLERVLAQGTASERTLRHLQAALEADLKPNHWLTAMRGERAGHHHFFENVRSGKVALKGLANFDYPNNAAPNSLEEWMFDKFPASVFRRYPEHLRFMNRLVEIAKLPIHERGPKLQECADQMRGNAFSKLLGMAEIPKRHEVELGCQGRANSAVAALACEHYRLKHGAWPAALDVLVKEKLLDAIPADPIDGLPLRYRRTTDGVVVYSIGVDGIDDGGHIDRARPLAAGVDAGFRLWDVPSRRQPPLGKREQE